MAAKSNSVDLENTSTRNSRDQSTTLHREDENEDIPPLVFLCNNCRVILGDNFAWVCAHQDLQVIALSSVTSSVVVEEGLETSTDGQDIGSTFTPLTCKSCQISIGRIYRTTPHELDIMRNVFALDCGRIKSYEVGSPAGKNTFKTTEEILALDVPTAKDLQNEILKLQGVVVSLNERLQALEQLVPDAAEESDISTVNGNDSNHNGSYNRRVLQERASKRPHLQIDKSTTNTGTGDGSQAKRKR